MKILKKIFKRQFSEKESKPIDEELIKILTTCKDIGLKLQSIVVEDGNFSIELDAVGVKLPDTSELENSEIKLDSRSF